MKLISLFRTPFRNASVKHKLIYIAFFGMGAGLLVALIMSLVLQWFQIRAELVETVGSQSRVIATNSIAALEFNDPKAATQTLGAMGNINDIDFAVIYGSDGKLFAAYTREGTEAPPESFVQNGELHSFSAKHLDVFYPIIIEGVRIATLYVRSSLSALYGEMLWNIWMLSVAMLAGLGMAVVMVSRLHPIITKPISDLVGLMYQVSREKNYALRAKPLNWDELGTLAEEFNGMLAKIQARDDELNQHRTHLEQEVAQRTARLTEAQRISHLGDWEWDVVNNALLWSDETYRIFGLTPQQFGATYEAFILAVHPEDRQLVEDRVREALELGHPYNIDHRILCPDSSVRYVHEQAEVIHNENGQAVKMLGTVQDITERKQIDQELMLAKQAADEANRAKSDFLANMSHEIRTPMNAIIGMTHLCLKTELGDKQRDYVEKAHRSAMTLMGIINSILDFSKIEANMLMLESKDFELRTILANIDSMVGHLAREKGLRFETSIHADVPDFLRGDELRLGQVLMNLAGNAVKFTAEGAVTLAVNLNSAEEHVVELEFSVNDTGIGLSDKQMQRLFHPFTQADASTTRQYGGTGLGLAISKQLVEMMGGRIWVESATGAGSNFRFTARFGHGKAFAASAPASGEELAAARARLRGAHILLAEDNPFNQQVAAELLEETGATVTLANNGREALALLNKERYDIVLMDVQMPEMDGYEATRKIRATPRLTGQKVIAMTANAMAEDRENCLASGMNDFITKPIDPDLMVLVLAKWMPERTGITPGKGLFAELRSGKERRSGVDRRDIGGRKKDDVIDLAILGQLVSNDPARVRKFALKFLETAQKTLDEMDAAHTGGDLAVLGGLGHKLKSSARTVGAMGFADLCQALESAGQAHDLSQAGMLLRQLHPLLERIARQVKQETA
jgi:PAS domain S-box-containing protein